MTPDGWSRSSLGTVGEWLSGGTPSKQDAALWKGPIPWISPKDMKRPRLSDAIDHVAEAALGDGTQLAPLGSLLMVVRGMILAHTFPVARAERALAFNQDVKALVPSAGFDSEFLLYWLQDRQPEVLRLVDVANHGTKRLPSERLFAMEVPRPPLPEQRKIAAILSSVDEAIETTQAVIDQLGVVKGAMMAELLTRGLPGRHTRFKHTEIGEVPAEWEVGALRDLAKLSSGGTPSRDRPEFWNGEIPWVKTGEIDYGVITCTEETISPAGLENSSAKVVPAGTLLLAMYGQGATRGRVAMLGVPAALNQACLAITPAPGLSARFLFHVFAARYELLRSLGHEGTQKNLNAKLVGDLVVPRPSPDEQQSIVDVLDALWMRSEAEAAVVEHLASARSALMSVLLTGEVRVKPDEEAA